VRFAGFSVRAAIGIGLLVALLAKVGFEPLVGLLRSPRWLYVAISLGFSAILVGVSCIKWRMFLRHAGVEVGFGRLVALYLIGILFNNFLPSNFGGDVVRGYGLGRQTGGMAQAFATVFLERFTGFAALVACAWLGMALAPRLLGAPPLVAALAASTTLLGTLLWVIVEPRFLDGIERFVPRRVAREAIGRARRLVDSVRSFGDLRLLGRAMFLSGVFYAAAVGNVFFSAQVFGQAPDVSGLVVAVPVVLVVSLVPISVGGVGLAEWAYVFCLGQIGVPAHEALALGLFLRAKTVLLSLVGAVLFATLRFGPAPVKAELVQ
jgi:hypothetical protein